MSAARTERLLNLLTLLLNARRPVSLREIREMEEFRAYHTVDPKSGERAFERDKAALIELGVPLRWISPEDLDDEEGLGGYVVDRDRYFLPDLKMSPTDLALLSIAGAAAAGIEGFPGRTAVRRALGKLGFDVKANESLPTLAHTPLRAGTDVDLINRHLEVLYDTVARQCQVDMVYQGRGLERTERRVDPYGLYYRQGHWYLMGHCHLRQDCRTFHLGRIVELSVAPGQKGFGYFEVPEGIDIEGHARTRPWEYAVHPPMPIRIRLAERLVPAIGELFGDHVEVERSEAGEAVISLTATQKQAVIEAVLPYGSAAEILEPVELREEVGAIYSGLAERYQEVAP